MKNSKENKRIVKELDRLGREIEKEIEEERRAAEATAAIGAAALFDDEDFDTSDLKEDKKAGKAESKKADPVKPARSAEPDAKDTKDTKDAKDAKDTKISAAKKPEPVDFDDEFDDEDFTDEELDALDDIDDDDLYDDEFTDEELAELDDEELDELLEEEEERKKRKGSTGAIVAVLVVLIVLLAGGAALWFVTDTKDIGFAAPQYAIRLGETQAIEPIFSPSFARNKKFELVSSDGAVVSFADGKITGIKPGTVTLTAMQNGKRYGSCTVTVLPVPVEEVTFGETPDEVYAGDTLELQVTVLPENATDKTIEYTVSDEGLASIEEGVITFKGAGEVTVTATNPESGLSDEFTVTVITTDPEQIVITAPDMLELSTTGTATVSFIPEKVADTGIIWTSSDPTVFTVENGTLIPRAVGNATLIATHASGVFAKKTITVVPVQGRSITIESKSGNTVAIKKKLNLTATVSPGNAADKTVTWSSSDESVATVSNKGVVTAKAAGEAEITASLKNGTKGTFKVSVPPKAVTRKAGFVTKPGAKPDTTVTMLAPDGYNLFIAFRSTDGDASRNFTVYVPDGKKLRTKLPAGSYYVTVAIGETWYGDKLWFFNEGEYFAMKDTVTLTDGMTLNCTMPGTDTAFERITEADFGA